MRSSAQVSRHWWFTPSHFYHSTQADQEHLNIEVAPAPQACTEALWRAPQSCSRLWGRARRGPPPTGRREARSSARQPRSMLRGRLRSRRPGEAAPVLGVVVGMSACRASIPPSALRPWQSLRPFGRLWDRFETAQRLRGHLKGSQESSGMHHIWKRARPSPHSRSAWGGRQVGGYQHLDGFQALGGQLPAASSRLSGPWNDGPPTHCPLPPPAPPPPAGS